MSALDRIIREVRNYEGLKRKGSIHQVVKMLNDVEGNIRNFGNDAAVLEMDKEDYLLFSIDGIWEKLITASPRSAGHSAIMSGINDILAMGGKPMAITWVLGYVDDKIRDEILEGLLFAAKLYGVDIVGGHTHPYTAFNEITTAIIGRVKRDQLITSFGCAAGDKIVMAVDLLGKFPSYKLGWNSDSMKTPQQIKARMEANWQIARERLAKTCKDISNPGILGTLGMMLEVNKVGAVVNVHDIPKPEGVEMADWAKVFPCYGFIYSVAPRKADRCVEIFKGKKITANVIGEVTGDRRLILTNGKESSVLFNFEKEYVTGLT